MTVTTLSSEQKADAIRRLTRGGDVARTAEAPVSAAEAEGRPRQARVRESDATTTGGKAVAVRLSAGEVAALDALQARIGATSRSDVLRALVRSSVGMLELPPEEAAQLAEIKAELHKIGVNVNQIALAANRGRIDMARQEWAAINELRQALPRLRTWLNGVVDEQRRRGIRLFRAFVEAERG
ncbi:plasmid mobilization relaxosome protein MobC [Paracoccus yeei]|uniref:plasmid mobilization relaxosome protein MobC n=1 Tax=Paracoccus yeei TaxID=147645 RepID=UPI001314CEF3|nr:plasmid mobilization relaxosome protein MobC [Paracoccus yeei]